MISVQTVDLDKLEMRLEKLMESYRDALKYVEHLPSIGRVGVKYHEEKQSTDQRCERGGVSRVRNPSHRWVARSLVRLFMESHIKSKLEVIIRYLRIERSVCIKEPESNNRAKKLNTYINQLDEFKKTLFNWNQPVTVVAKAPWLPAVIALATPVLVQLIGISSGLLHTLIVLGVILLEMYMFLSPLPLRLGFRVKRAIFAEGKTLRGLFEDSAELITWVNFPRTNIYQVEDQVFEVIGVPKPKEFPLDVVMGFTPLVAFFLTALLLGEVVNQLIRGDILRLLDIFPFLIFVFSVDCIFFIIGRRNLRQRRKQGKM